MEVEAWIPISYFKYFCSLSFSFSPSTSSSKWTWLETIYKYFIDYKCLASDLAFKISAVLLTFASEQLYHSNGVFIVFFLSDFWAFHYLLEFKRVVWCTSVGVDYPLHKAAWCSFSWDDRTLTVLLVEQVVLQWQKGLPRAWLSG